MKNIEILYDGIIKLRSEGFYFEDVSIDKISETLFGDPKQIIEDFEKKFAGDTTPELVDDLVKAGGTILAAYEMLVQREFHAVTPSASEVVSAHMKGEINIDKILAKRVKTSEKWCCVVSAMQMIGELQRDMKHMLPSKADTY